MTRSPGLNLVGRCAAILTLACASAAAETITLARDGGPAATIVIAANAPERLSIAARELQHYVKALCGVELPIRTDGRRVGGTGLYIGRCEPGREDDPPGPTLNPEAYAIRVRDGNVLFAGRHPTPIFFAVASFIEGSLGVRWFAPGQKWEYIPSGTPGRLQVDVKEVVKAPDTSPRIWSGHNFADSWNLWNLRNKNVSGEVIPRRNFQNNLHTIFPPSRYAKTHPEYYPLVDGKRWIPPADYRYWRPCETNPDVIRITVEAARRHFDRHPESDSFSLGMDDISHLCGCPNCRALDASPDAYEKRAFSDRHYKFVNTVAREIARSHPGRYIGTLIYAIARQPPETVERLEDNVFGFITEVSARWCEPGVRDADHALTREWARRCRHLSRYDYFGLGTFTPRYYPHAMAEQMRFDKALGFEGMYAELNTFLPHTAPMIWAFSKLQWDAALDIDALLEEFMVRMFGPAAATMARYFDLLERSWNAPPPTRRDWEHRNLFIQAQAIPPAAVREGLDLLEEALTQADAPVIRERIETIRAALQYAGYALRSYALSEPLTRHPIADLQGARDATQQILELARISAEREPFWAAARSRDDLLGENIRGLAGKGYLMVGRVANLERGAAIGALRVIDWYQRHAPDQVAEVMQKLQSAGQGGVGDLVRAWAWAREQSPPNLLRNAAFEEMPSPAAASGPDGESVPPVPPGWSTYGDAGRARFAIDPAAGRDGTAAACITNAHSGAVFLQRVDVQPGERYLCVAYARAVPEGRDGKGYLVARFQTPRGAWHPRSDLEPQVYMTAAGGWQPLLMLAAIPEGAGRLVFMVGAKAQPEGVTVAFDDAGLYRLPTGD